MIEIFIEQCRARQQRILGWMERENVEVVVVTQIAHVQYLVGPRFREVFSPLAMLSCDGHLTLIAPRREPPVAAADEVLLYESNSLSTLRNDQSAKSSHVLLDHLERRSPTPKRIGCEFSTFPVHIAQRLSAECVDVEPELYRLRRRKDPDELARIRKAIAATGKMYERARELIEPGVNELDVFNELQSVANREFGEMMTGTGNDFACGMRGGPPRDRAIEDGELYILDLGPAYRGYFADNARTIAVNGQPSKPQRDAWEACVRVLSLVEDLVRPGVGCTEVFAAAQTHLDEAGPWKFDHHLGHGIGLFPHETPHLNPNWDDTFCVGDVFTAEPGLYGDDLNAGIRVENDYLVTQDGVELLSDFPLDL